MKINHYIIAFLILVLGVTSCQDYLNVLPENNQSTSQFWKTKEDVEAVLGAGYVKLRDAQEYLMLWGESRGNGIYFGVSGTTGQLAAQKLRQFDILATNDLAKWDKLYAIINMANSVIKYAPTVQDASFNVNVMHSYLSEAYFQRALAYFYLVRIWKDVPFVTLPYVDDSAPYDIAKTSGDEILKSCLVDLNGALESAKIKFPESSLDNPINTKGRATKWSIYTLIADINLWLGNYDDCIPACESVINSGQIGLISGSTWFTNFCNASYNGNSNESIFEIQYSYDLNQTNSFLSWFSTNKYYYISPYQQYLYELEPTDLRGLNASYTSDGKIWKYIGIKTYTSTSDSRNSSTQNDQNWIIYRLADVYLMEAEAYAMKGDLTSMTNSIKLVNAIRKRASLSETGGANQKLDMMKIILQERQREFFCEGKNWFDLVRIGNRPDAGFKDYFIEQVLQVASASTSSMIRAILQDNNSWYLPINSDELLANQLLVQNPYYANLGN
jgi:starch-binding outer membrane protein, SusD/RagB family